MVENPILYDWNNRPITMEAKMRILDNAEKNGLNYEEYIEIENQIQQVLEGTYGVF